MAGRDFSSTLADESELLNSMIMSRVRERSMMNCVTVSPGIGDEEDDEDEGDEVDVDDDDDDDAEVDSVKDASFAAAALVGPFSSIFSMVSALLAIFFKYALIFPSKSLTNGETFGDEYARMCAIMRKMSQ